MKKGGEGKGKGERKTKRWRLKIRGKKLMAVEDKVEVHVEGKRN